jgi:hypothetical protein
MRRDREWLERPKSRGEIRSASEKLRSIKGGSIREILGGFGGWWAAGGVVERLHPDIISNIYERVARLIGMSEKQVNQVSAYSVRLGGGQDLALNIDLGAVMQVGRWKSTRITMRYGDGVLIVRRHGARFACSRRRPVISTRTIRVGSSYGVTTSRPSDAPRNDRRS